MRYWWLFIPSLILQIVAAIFQSSIPQFIGRIAGGIFDGTLTYPVLLSLSKSVVVFGVSAGLIFLLKNWMIEIVSQRLERNTQDELYGTILGKSLTFHDQQTIGDLMSRAAADVRQLNFMINPGFQLVFQALVGIIVPFTFIAMINPQLLLVPILFLITFGITLRQYNNKLTPVAWQQRMSVSRINSRLNETISGMALVRANTQEDYEREIFSKNIQEYKKAAVKQGILQGRYYPLLLLGLATVLAFLHAVILVSEGVISFDDLITFLLLMQLLRFPTFINIFAITVLTMGVASAQRITELITWESEIDANPSGHDAPIKGSIRFENVSFGYKADKPIVHNLSFSVDQGQTVALVGMTGSGKSTITKLLTRLYDPQQGRILIDDIPLGEWSINSLRSQMALVEQDIFLFSRSILENIRLSKPDATEEEVQSAAKLAQIHQFIMTLPDGYETEIGERGVQLSGGQRQRIAIARAILKNPQILILDDASSAIDSQTEDEIQKAISEVLKGRNSFLITHRIAQIRKADLIILLDKGRIIGMGSHEHLLKTVTKYSDIFSTLKEVDE